MFHLSLQSKVYFILSTLLTLVMIYFKYTIFSIGIKITFTIVWTSILSIIYRHHEKLTWFMVFLPFIFMYAIYYYNIKLLPENLFLST